MIGQESFIAPPIPLQQSIAGLTTKTASARVALASVAKINSAAMMERATCDAASNFITEQ
jgi:hypothetical protein